VRARRARERIRQLLTLEQPKAHQIGFEGGGRGVGDVDLDGGVLALAPRRPLPGRR
jgi:hypothetical protein